MRKIILTILLAVSSSAFAGGWTINDGNTSVNLYYDGNLVAKLRYSDGWKIRCKNRKSVSVRTIDSKEYAISAAQRECRK